MLAATHSVVGVMNEPIWRSLGPTQRVQFIPKDHNWFTLSEVLVKVSFGERGGTYGVFQKKSRENPYYELRVGFCLYNSNINILANTYYMYKI